MKYFLLPIFCIFLGFFAIYGIVSFAMHGEVSTDHQDCIRAKYAYMAEAIQTRADLKACEQKVSK